MKNLRASRIPRILRLLAFAPLLAVTMAIGACDSQLLGGVDSGSTCTESDATPFEVAPICSDTDDDPINCCVGASGEPIPCAAGDGGTQVDASADGASTCTYDGKPYPVGAT